jgi:type IV secretory pathway VirB10-like protein
MSGIEVAFAVMERSPSQDQGETPMSRYQIESTHFRNLLLPAIVATFFVVGACQQASESPPDSTLAESNATGETSTPSEEDIAAQQLAEANAKQAEIEAAQAELAAREAALAEQEEQLRQRAALQEEQERVAAQQAAIKRRERQAAEKEAELRQREVMAAAREREVQDREREAALAEARRDELAQVREEAYAEPVSEPEQEQEPAAEAAERMVEATLRPGTVLEVEITETLSSRSSQIDDTFRSRIVRDVYTDAGELAIPAGSEVVGRVIEVTPLKRVGGQASLEVEFTHLVSSAGGTTELRASFVELGADRGKDKKKIIGAAVAGAILGRILGDPSAKSTILGAAVGAATGTAVVAKAKDRDAEIPAGQVLALELEEVVTVTTRVTGLAPN